MRQKLGAPKKVEIWSKNIFFKHFLFSIWIDRTIRRDSETIFFVDLDLYFQGQMSFFKVKVLIKQHPISLNRLMFKDEIFVGHP